MYEGVRVYEGICVCMRVFVCMKVFVCMRVFVYIYEGKHTRYRSENEFTVHIDIFWIVHAHLQ